MQTFINTITDHQNVRKKIDINEGRNRQFYNKSWRLQYTTLNNRTTRQKVSKEKEDLNNTINHIDLTETYRTLYPTQTH